MSEDTLLTITQFIFTLCLVIIFISDIKSMANGVSKLKNKIYRVKHKKEIDLKERNIKNLYSYIFYAVLPGLTRDQFIKVCSHNFKYNGSYYELYLEKEQGNEDFQYEITLKKIVQIRRHMSIFREIAIDTDKEFIFFFHFTRNGPKNVLSSRKCIYEDNLGIVLTALILIYLYPKNNTIDDCPEFKGDRDIYEQLD